MGRTLFYFLTNEMGDSLSFASPEGLVVNMVLFLPGASPLVIIRVMVRKCVPNQETINGNKIMGKEGIEPSTPRFGDACSYSTELQARAHYI